MTIRIALHVDIILVRVNLFIVGFGSHLIFDDHTDRIAHRPRMCSNISDIKVKHVIPAEGLLYRVENYGVCGHTHLFSCVPRLPSLLNLQAHKLHCYSLPLLIMFLGSMQISDPLVWPQWGCFCVWLLVALMKRPPAILWPFD